MPALLDDAIVLRVWDYSETSQTAALFTRAHGSIRALAKGSRRPRAPFSGGLDAVTRGEAIWFPRAASDLATLAAWDAEDVYPHVRQGRVAHAVGVHLADLAARFLHDHDPHPALYDALHDALAALADPADAPRTLLRFQWALLRDTGYSPEIHRDLASGRDLPSSASYVFDPHRGSLAPAGARPPNPPASAGWRVRIATVEALRWVSAGADNPAPAPDSLLRAARLLGAYASTVLGAEPATLSPALRAVERTSLDPTGAREAPPGSAPIYVVSRP